MSLDGFPKSIEQVKEAVVPLTKAIRENMAEGTIGERGEEWALGQVLILLFIALGNIPVLGNLLMFLAGPGFVVSGIALGGAGVITLGKSLSPWPVPVDDNELQTSGVFGLMRHPSYAGEIRYAYLVSCSSSSTGSFEPKNIHDVWFSCWKPELHPKLSFRVFAIKFTYLLCCVLRAELAFQSRFLMRW